MNGKTQKRKRGGAYNASRSRSRLANLQRSLGIASTKVGAIKATLAEEEVPASPATPSVPAVPSVPASPATPSVPTVPSVPPTGPLMARISNFGRRRSRIANVVQTPPPSPPLPAPNTTVFRSPPPPPPLPEPEPSPVTKEWKPLERQAGKRHLTKSTGIRFSNRNEVFGSNLRNRNTNWEKSAHLAAARVSVSRKNITPLKNKTPEQPMTPEEAKILANITDKYNNYKDMVKALNQQGITLKSAKKLAKRLNLLYGPQ